MEIEIKTGFGYLKDAQGNITDKCELLPGKHKIRDGYTFIEVATRAALNAVQVHRPEKTENPAQTRRRKISEELEKMAIERLKTKNDPDFK